MRKIKYKNPPFKKTIAQEIKTDAETKVPLKNEVKKLWWSKYNSEDLKNPKFKMRIVTHLGACA